MKNFSLLSILLIALAWLAGGANLLPITSAKAEQPANDQRFDLNFGNSGRVFTDFEAANDIAYAAAVQPDGKIVAAGQVRTDFNTAARYGVARYNSNGSLDQTFGTNGKVTIAGGVNLEAAAQAVHIQPDGKIVVTGSSSAANSNSQFTVVRLNADGSPDANFDNDGIAFASFGSFSQFASTSILQPDGKIVLTGFLNLFASGNTQDWAAARFNADGSLDSGFGTDGKLIINNDLEEEAFGAALQPDGKIIIAGLSGNPTNGLRLTLERINQNGTIDQSFGASGKVVSTFANSFATSVAIQTDGKIIAAGSRFVGNKDDFTAERYNADGSLDTNFGSGGRILTVVSAGANRANDIVLQPDGKIILSGRAANAGQTSQFAVARYTANGALDATFSGDGIQITEMGLDSEVWQSFVQPDAKIVAAGVARTGNSTTNQTDFALVRYDANGAGPLPFPTPTPPTGAGALDASFDLDGKKILDFAVANTTQAQAEDVAVQADGKSVVVGQLQAGFDQRFAVARLNADGSFDNTFDADGRLLITFSTAQVQSGAKAVEIQPDGKILIAGQTNAGEGGSAGNGSQRIALARLNANGSFDASFGSNGLLVTTINLAAGAENAVVNDLKLQPDGKILVAGAVQRASTATGRNDFFVARYNQNGALDNSFDQDGRIFTDFAGENDQANSIALAADGKIIVAGNANFTGDFAIARFNSNGSLDTTFDQDGKFTLNEAVDNGAEVFAVADNKILLVGSSAVENTNPQRYSIALLRLNQNGGLDSTFDQDGKAFSDVARDFLPNAAVLQADGKIVTVGGTAADFGIARFNQTGALDAQFGIAGLVRTDFLQPPALSSSDRAFGAAVQPDGKIIVAGSASNNSGARFAVARYKSVTAQKPVNDFDGDNKTDFVVYRGGDWYVLQSSNAQPLTAQWGLPTDVPCPGDFDADGKTDFAVFRENTGDADRAVFYILQSSNGQSRVEQFGRTGDVPIIGDWDADGKSDLAVYRDGGVANAQSYFYYRPSSAPSVNFTSLAWGVAGDKPVAGDFDGDGKQDAAVYRQSNNAWYIRQSADGALRTAFWGLPGDKRVSGDFDGDSKTDIAVFRGGTWYVINSANNSIRYQQWGIDTDVLTPGDFDGDGRTDFAVWRNSVFYVLSAANQTVGYRNWGVQNDVLPYGNNP